jgi:hypothetical protein
VVTKHTINTSVEWTKLNEKLRFSKRLRMRKVFTEETTTLFPCKKITSAADNLLLNKIRRYIFPNREKKRQRILMGCRR